MARRWSGAASCRPRRGSHRLSAPPGLSQARVRPAPRGLRIPAKLLCRHHAWLELRLGLPEVCHFAKVLRDPLVAIDTVKVAFSPVVKNEHTRRAPVYPRLHLFYCHEHSARRAASQDGFALHQTATTDDTVQVR